jgi:hypothetical protein
MEDPQAVDGAEAPFLEEEEEEDPLAPLIRLAERWRAKVTERQEEFLALGKELSLKLRRLVLTETTLEILQPQHEPEEMEMLERLQTE